MKTLSVYLMLEKFHMYSNIVEEKYIANY